ncbi:MAG: M67 family metallopeptidase [Eubacterium sp.]|nr:M67 family metallopeptidase [Eubacterium sp.]
MSIIRMKAADYDAIIAYAKEHLPEEACGLLAGELEDGNRVVKKVYFLENKDHATDHFTIDPKQQLNCIKDIREHGMCLLGNWHSHPESPSRPSKEDIKLAYDKNSCYMIASFLTGTPIMNAFHIENDSYQKEDLRVYTEEYYF